ncbi:HAD family hydrolase [Streptomyces sp. NPDC005728]|uniref:HAD family hydrolase n=1 Tax=Streptomyces sp. NPDC005728 TaxID=3157054 RepID=UPI003403F1A3
MGGAQEDVEDAFELLTDAGCVLFDFDGPVCRLYPHGASMAVAVDLRKTPAEGAALDFLTEAERTGKDPYLVLRAADRAGKERDLGDLVERMDAKLTEGELAAVLSALPTPGADQLVEWLHGRGSRLVVVTNNAACAADRYLRDHGLRRYFEAIHGRSADPGLMKPHPDVLHRALRGLRLPPDDAVMIGDTPADFAAAEQAGVRFIGYGRNAEKRLLLRDAGAKCIVSAYSPVLALARHSGWRPARTRHAGPGVDGFSPS